MLAAVSCLAHAIHVPMYPTNIQGAIYQGVPRAAAPYHDASTAATHHGPVYSGPLATPVILPNGFVADTPEVVAVRGAHLTAMANARAAAATRGGSSQWASDGSYPTASHNVGGGRYVGPIATPVVLPNGFLADTPEVAAAKAAHLSMLAAHIPYAAAHAYQQHHGYPGHLYHHG